jgi:hypothetical protein
MNEFDISELSKFTKKVIKLATDYPKETKKFIKKEVKKLSKKAESIAQQNVEEKTSGTYLKSFKTGEVYQSDDADCANAYNDSSNSNLIEYGQVSVTQGKTQNIKFTQGKHIFEKAGQEFEPQFNDDVENFAEEIINKGLK